MTRAPPQRSWGGQNREINRTGRHKAPRVLAAAGGPRSARRQEGSDVAETPPQQSRDEEAQAEQAEGRRFRLTLRLGQFQSRQGHRRQAQVGGSSNRRTAGSKDDVTPLD